MTPFPPADPTDAPPVEKHRARASALLDLNRPDDAARELAAALSLAPNDARLLCLMASVQNKINGAVSAGLPWAERAVAADPREAWAHALRFFALMHLNRIADAKQAAQACADLEPENPLVYHNLVDVCMAEEKWDEAKAFALHACALDPSREMAFLDLARVCVGQANHAQSAQKSAEAEALWDDAESAVRHALQLHPNDALGLEMLGHILKRRPNGRGGDVLSVYVALSQIDPHSPAAQDYLRHTAQTRLLSPSGTGIVAGMLTWMGEAVLLWGLHVLPFHAALCGCVCAVLLVLVLLRFGRVPVMARQKTFRALPTATQTALHELARKNEHAGWWQAVQWAALTAFVFPVAAAHFSRFGLPRFAARF